jgi:hypothetical protein
LDTGFWILDTPDFGFWISILDFGFLDFPAGSRFQVPGSRFQVPGSRFQVPGSRFQAPGSTFRSLFLFLKNTFDVTPPCVVGTSGLPQSRRTERGWIGHGHEEDCFYELKSVKWD